MKQFLAMFVAAVLVLSMAAFAEDLDLSKFTDAELEGLQLALDREKELRKGDDGSAEDSAEPAAESAPVFEPLQTGSYGAEVRAAQSRLKALGYYFSSADGIFGERSEKAVKCFETINGYEEDGILTQDEYNWLMSAKALALLPMNNAVKAPNGMLGIKVSENGNYTDDEGQQWLCDEVDLENGTYTQRIGQVVIDGNVAIVQVGDGSTKFYSEVYNMEKAEDYTEKFACALPVMPSHQFPTGTEGVSGYVDVENKYADKNWLYISNGESDTVEEMTEWLKKNPVVVAYVLANPVTGSLTDALTALYSR